MEQFNTLKIKEFIKENIAFFLFVFFFFLYLFISIILNCCSDTNFSSAWDVVYSLDSKARIKDFIDPLYNGYNCPETHPFTFLFIPPLISTLNLFGFSPILKISFVQSFFGGISVCFTYKLLELVYGKKFLNVLLTLIYACSFSALIFTTSPENYIFAGTFSILNLYYVLKIIKEPSINKLTWTNLFILAFCSFSMFAINTVCLAFSFVLFLFLLFSVCKKNIKSIISNFSKFLTIFLILFSLFATLHDFVYSHMDTYHSLIFKEKKLSHKIENLKSFTNKGYYATVELHIIEGTFIKPFYAMPSAEVKDEEPNSIGVEWRFIEEHYNNYFIPSLLLFGLSFLGFMFSIKRNKNKSFALIFASLTLLQIIANCCFCPWECFLYSLNAFIYLIMLLGAFLSEYKGYFYCLLYALFLCFQIGINFTTLYQIKEFLWKYTSESYSFTDSYLLIILASILICLFVWLFNKYFKNFSLDKKYLLFIILYFCLIIIYSIFTKFYQG